MLFKDAILEVLNNNRYICLEIWDDDYIYFDKFFRKANGTIYTFTELDSISNWEFYTPTKFNLRNKHSDLIHIWADTGCTIEQFKNGEWVIDINPQWLPSAEYRKQPRSSILYEYKWIYFENFKMKTVGFFTEEELRSSDFILPTTIFGFIKRERK